MSLIGLVIKHESPSVKNFIALRESIGWGIADELAATSLKNSLFHVTIYHQDKTALTEQLVAMGRVVGDGAMYFYIQDVIVSTNFQGQGLGRLVMNEIEVYLAKAARKGATIGLLAAKGKEAFYQKYDYQLRPNQFLGHGMCRFVE